MAIELLEELHKYRPSESFVRVVAVLAFGVLTEFAARVFVPRYTNRMIKKRTSQIIDLERRKRGATVVNFAASVVRLVVWMVVFVSLLAEINVNVGPILAGAGVMGAALAFGAQNIVKDYLAGFFILLENQYMLGDVVRIGAVTGTVEEVSMRTTVLRAADGAMHVIPNGTIQGVANLTATWARVIIDVGIAYSSVLDSALEGLAHVGKAFYSDEAWRKFLLEAPEVLGVNALTDGSVVLRLTVKVIPEYQWKIQRELLRRIKIEFDARSIVAPAVPATSSVVPPVVGRPPSQP